MIDRAIEAYTGNPTLLAISAFAFLIGYIEYIYALLLVRRENAAPFPVWMHALYLAHDFTGAVVFFLLAQQHDWFYFFTGASIALFLWNFFEVYNLYKAATVERQELWGNEHGGTVTLGYALLQILMMIAIMVVVVNYMRIYMDDAVMFKWFALTNVVMAIGPGFLWRQRRSRRGASIGLAIVIVIGTINTFLPQGWGMWTTAFPETFDTFWFYALGAVCVPVSVYNLICLLRFPPKVSQDGRRPIW